MILISFILSFAILANIALGITVFLTNTERKANQAYLISATFMLLWLLANLRILFAVANTSELTILTINVASAISTCIPSSFQLLRLSIKYPSISWPALLKRSAVQLISNLIVIALCFAPSYITAVEFPSPDSTTELAHPVYGPAFILYALYFIGSICVLGYNLFLDRKHLQGAQRLESEFLVFACLSGLCVGVVGILFVLIFKSSAVMPITNAASVFIISLIVAYGITFYKILTVSALLRKATAYALLMAYLCAVYYTSWFILHKVCGFLGISTTHSSHLLSTIIVVFSIPPARERLEKATERLFRNANMFDVQGTMKQAGEIFQSVTTINALLRHFSELLLSATGAKRVVILTSSGTGFRQAHPVAENASHVTFDNEDAVVKMLSSSHEPASIDNLHRRKQTPIIRGVVKNLKDNNISVATGTFSKEGLSGIVLVGSRRKGRIYDKTELEALQLLCNQFAVALENALLYTEVQDSKIRNDIMLDQLVSGVIFASPTREITLLNHEAQRITGLTEAAIGQHIEILPKPIATTLESTLNRERGLRNIDAPLFGQSEGDKSIRVRMGSAYLIGHDNKPMGSLLVFTDMTELKQLEEQVRRSDQLSSVGTLAAGMAHEIKNPLVTIKTFTQLLPERYGDKDFRNDFSSLVGHEVARIDGIVNQLLSFSKPSTPHLEPIHLHETIEHTLKLVQEQLPQKNITMHNNCRAHVDLINGDADMLTQALVNLNLNAIDAIGEDGKITVGTINCTYRFANGDDPEKSTAKQCIRIQISDTGKGIERTALSKVFDPFFTSKSEGTGMGLSVAHGVVQEHHGVMEVESEPGRGTTFYIYIPVDEGASA